MIVILVLAVSNLVDPISENTSFTKDLGANDSGNVPGIDSDGDGLKDTDEDRNSNGRMDAGESSPTDPFNKDSDGDGLDDGEEFDLYTERFLNISLTPNWVVYAAIDVKDISLIMESLGPIGDIDQDGIPNILDPDSDNDGIVDGDEVEGGTDPLDPDSDGDLIPDGVDPYFEDLRDQDGDGMDDSWEEYFGVDEPSGDPDQDGISNFNEFERGTYPNHMDDIYGHVGRFDPLKLFGYPDPEQIHFTTEGIGPRYLRVSTFETFDGEKWSQGPFISTNRGEGLDPSLVNITLNGYWRGYVPTPDGIIIPVAADPLEVYPNPANNLPELREDIIYTGIPLRSYSFLVEESELSTSRLRSFNSSASSAAYTDVPSSTRTEIWELSNKWERGAKSDFQRAERVIALLSERCSYSTITNMASDDPLYDFLFLTTRGNALDFSTAAVSLLRMMDIPSRLVVGYSLGQQEDGYRVYREGHLHAWVEVELEDVGWVQFEVTPPLSNDVTGGSGITGDGVDSNIMGPIGGIGGGTLRGTLDPNLDPDGDIDGDGLSNGLEESIGTNPRNWDTDRDSLDDKTELDLGTDPLIKDSDGDMLEDGEEYHEYLTDPTMADTDLGGMPDGWEVYHIPDPLDPNDPKDDAPYVDIDGDGLNSTIEKLLNTLENDADTDSDGLTDGEEFFSYHTDPLNDDTDGDNLTDKFEVTILFSDPLRPDTDGDGLPDGEEFGQGTDPRNEDTDNDGATDHEEWIAGTDPLDPDTDGDGLLDGFELNRGYSPLSEDTDGDLVPDGFELWYGMRPLIYDETPPPVDTDGDGLTDDLEALGDTSPLNNDTDSDGILDGMEMFMLFTNPLDPDSDLDGITDKKEVFIHYSNPNVKDTDGDSLLDSMELAFNSSMVHPDTDQDGARDDEEFTIGSDPRMPDTDQGGLKDGLEILTNRSPLNSTDDLPYIGDMDGDGLLDLEERDLGTDPANTDTDGDGLSDGFEVRTSLSDPLKEDTDGDGLTDLQEFSVHGTDPLSFDTDDDGINDRSELEDWGSDPLKNDTDGDGLLDGEERDLQTLLNDPDTDGDGLTDGFEVKTDIYPDRVGLQTTDPRNPDSDEGGASDGIEWKYDGDPLRPSDDILFRDEDGDGLLDTWELQNGTDPNKRDTDDDGIIDPNEILGLQGPSTDPLDPDSDNDTLKDGEEVLEGVDGYITDPNSDDTDNDTLKDGAEVNGLFGYVSDPTSKDGDGDSLNDTIELFTLGTDPLNEDTDGDGLPDGWIDGWRGLPKNGRLDEGEFEDGNLDGVVDPTLQWNGRFGPGETDPLDPDSDDGGVNDGEEVFKGFNPLLAIDDDFIKDTDGDGIPDYIENGTTVLTLWNDPDTDGDGLYDGEDVIGPDGTLYLGEGSSHNGFEPTDPLKSDIDGDGQLDGWEVENRTDPNSADTDGDGLYDGFNVLGNDGRFHLGELSPKNFFDPQAPYDPTDPLDFDSDDDGLHDGNYIPQPQGDLLWGEFYYGTDPNDPDTDDDGLTDHYEVVTIYSGFDDTVDWVGKPDFSSQKRTDPTNKDSDGGKMPDGLEVELGLNPLDRDDDDGPLDFDGDGLSNDLEKNGIYYQPEDPKNDNVDWDGDGVEDGNPAWNISDTDGDGLSDGEEYLNRKHRTNPVSPDSDRDELDDFYELRISGTDPNLYDSDDDGLSDYQEIIALNYSVSFVDWDLDGVIDNRTDPMNRDTDLDSISDGNEILRDPVTNPLDPGDPGVELLPEEEPFVFIDESPGSIRKETDPVEGSFQVAGVVKNSNGRAIEGIGVVILIVETEVDREMVKEMTSNPSLRVGSLLATRSDGSFRITCTPTEDTPFGEVKLYAVTLRANLDGRRYLPSPSEPEELEVLTDTSIIVDNDELRLARSAMTLVSGRLVDIGGLGIKTSPLTLTSSFLEPLRSVTDGSGYFSFKITVPDSIGTWEMGISYPGSAFTSPSTAAIDLNVIEGPFIGLEPINDVYVSGDGFYINGTITGGDELPQGIVNASFYNRNDPRSEIELNGQIQGSDISVTVELDPDIFRPGTYDIIVYYRIGLEGFSSNSSLSFELVDSSNIILIDEEIIRGPGSELRVLLLQGNDEPYWGERIRINFPEIQRFSGLLSTTNETGYASFPLAMDQTTRLGITPVSIVHLVNDEQGTIPDTYEGYVTIKAPVSLEILDSVETLPLLNSQVINGRLLDDTGQGVVGDDTIEMVLNGELIGTASTTEGGWFQINEIIPQYSRLGTGVLSIEFTGLKDERSEWYQITQVLIEVNVVSRTYINLDENLEDLNSTIKISLKDERGDPVSFSPVRIGIGFGFDTYLTGEDGNLTVDLGEVEAGDVLNIEYPGDLGRSYLPANLTVTVPEKETEGPDQDILRFLIPLVLVILLMAGAFGISRLLKLRKDISTIKAREKRRSSAYPFEPASEQQRLLIDTYKGTLKDLDEKGLRRPSNLTPDEFRKALEIEDEAIEGMGPLTRLFEEARYSDHTISSHLIGKARRHQDSIRREVEKKDSEKLRRNLKDSISGMAEEVERPIIWKMNVDHSGDLRDLLGEKEVSQ